MTTMASLINFTAFFGKPRFSWPRLRFPELVIEEVSDASRARTEFVKEMMQACPDAFASELDTESAMLFISGRF